MIRESWKNLELILLWIRDLVKLKLFYDKLKKITRRMKILLVLIITPPNNELLREKNVLSF